MLCLSIKYARCSAIRRKLEIKKEEVAWKVALIHPSSGSAPVFAHDLVPNQDTQSVYWFPNSSDYQNQKLERRTAKITP